MGIRKVGSRPLVVDGQSYRWRVRQKPTYVQAAFGMAFTASVEHVDGGAVLLVVTNGPRPDNWLERPGAIVTPAVIEGAVRRALSQGWRPNAPGPAFVVGYEAALAEPRDAADRD